MGKGRNRIKWLALALLALMLLTTASAQEFTGTATGFGGPVTITISVENGAIAACIITAEQETPSIGGQAAKTMEEIIAQTGAADAVSGATMTSNAANEALAQCLRQAGLLTDVLQTARRLIASGHIRDAACPGRTKANPDRTGILSIRGDSGLIVLWFAHRKTGEACACGHPSSACSKGIKRGAAARQDNGPARLEADVLARLVPGNHGGDLRLRHFLVAEGPLAHAVGRRAVRAGRADALLLRKTDAIQPRRRRAPGVPAAVSFRKLRREAVCSYAFPPSSIVCFLAIRWPDYGVSGGKTPEQFSQTGHFAIFL